MSRKHDRSADLRAIAEGRLMLNVRNGVTVPRSMLAMIADEIDALRAAPLAPAKVGGIAEWQPIATAPREPVVSGATFGPMILLGSVYGQRAIGYWGRGAGNRREGWVSPHDHMVMDYWGQFTHWQTIPDIPENDDDA